MDKRDKDRLVAEVFSSGRPDWSSEAGRQVLECAIRHLEYVAERKYRMWYDSAVSTKDLVQASLVKLLAHLDRGNEVKARTCGELRGLLNRIIHSVFSDLRYSSHGRHQQETLSIDTAREEDSPSLSETIGEESGILEKIHTRRLHGLAMEHIRKVYPLGAEAFELHLAGYTALEIASRLSISTINAHKRVSRARRIYHSFVSNHAGGPSGNSPDGVR